MREELIGKLDQLLEISKDIDELEDQYMEHQQIIDNYNDRIDRCKLPFPVKAFITILVAGLIGQVLTFITGGMQTDLLWIVIMFVPAYYAVQKANEKYIESKKDEIAIYESSIEKEKNIQEELVEQVKYRTMGYDDLFEDFPLDYFTTIALTEMRKYLVQKRANSIPEMINLYEEQLHRWKLEEQNEMILESQRRQEERLANIEFYSALSASFEAASMMDRD